MMTFAAPGEASSHTDSSHDSLTDAAHIHKPQCLAEKIWDEHVIVSDAADLIYIDMHLTHEVTSPQPFEGLRKANRLVRRPDLTLATSDHDVPTDGTPLELLDSRAQLQLNLQRDNCRDFKIPRYGLGSPLQGIVHVIGPEQGLTLPGMTIVCGDSHTATHGAFGAVAFGIGTSQVEQVLATQSLWMPRPKFSRVTLNAATVSCSAKDIALAILYTTGTDGLRGTLVEFAGSVPAQLTMEERMTVCNMAIEAGARSGLIAPDDTVFDYLFGRKHAPKGALWDVAVEYWRTLSSDAHAIFDQEYTVDEQLLVPRATWGITPAQNLSLDENIPDPDSFTSVAAQESARRALEYMGLRPRMAMRDIPIQRVFIGSCTNGRIEDLRAAAQVIAGKKISAHVQGLVVPGSMAVKAQAEAEGLAKIFLDAGFSWRNAGCSMCIGMNGDTIAQGEHCASTSNRNFESRQGKGGRTHLVSPQVAAASALTGHLTAPEDIGAEYA